MNLPMSQCPYANPADPEHYIGGAPSELFARLRREAPISWQEDPVFNVGYWAITRRRHLDFISKSPELFSSSERTTFYPEIDEDTATLMRAFILNMDPPEHNRYRSIVRSAFTPKSVESYEPRFRAIAKEIVGRVLARGHCEFVSEIAAELPMIAICELMGIPLEDRHQFNDWANTMMSAGDDHSGTSEEKMLASFNVFNYGRQLAERHREVPNQGILGALIDGRVDGERLTDLEFCNFFLLLVVAGIETTRTVTCHGMRLFMENPDQYQRLQKNPALLPGAVEEILRRSSAVIQMRRTAMQDVEIEGVQIRKGDKIVLFYYSANHDEEVFPEPERFDIDREQRDAIKHEHRAFGIGEHFCLGSHLARLELKVIFEEVLRHINNPKLAAPIQWSKSYLVNSMVSMPIEFDPASANTAD